MSESSENTKTAVICVTQRDLIPQLSSLLFKVAYSYAREGDIVFILSNPLADDFVIDDQYSYFPEVLERIIFKYFTTSRDIIEWCHEVQYLPRKPSMLLVPLERFCACEDFELIRLCAALLDAARYLSNCVKSKQHYLLATALINVDNYHPFIHTFFNFSWIPTIIDHYQAILTPFREINEGEENFTFIIKNDSPHDDLKKIFQDCPKTRTDLALKL